MLWRDHDTYIYDRKTSPYSVNDVYYREVSDATGLHVEILWWDQHPFDTYLIHNVYKASLYPSGLYTVTYDLLSSTGMETVGYVEDNLGIIHDYGFALDLQEGMLYEHLIP